LGAGPARAAEFRAEVDRMSVSVGGQIVLRLTVAGAGQASPRIRIAPPNGFESYSLGTSQNISIRNGQVETSVTESFVLVAKKEGSFRLGPFEINLNGEVLRTHAIIVQVVAGGTQPQEGARPGGATRDRGGRPAPRTPEFFVRAEIDKHEAFVNQALTLTFKFYSRVRLSRDPEYTPPTATGFWVEDLPPVRRFYEDVSGVPYLVNELKYALFPTTTGELTVGPAILRVQTAPDNPLDLDPFQMFGRDPFAGMRERAPEVLETDPIRVRVRPLPEKDRPADFSGLVGNYNLTARLDKATVEANGPVTLSLTIAGDGNLQTAPDPRVQLPDGVRAYDSGSRVNTSKEGYKLRGEKVVEKVFIPQAAGDLVIPPATLVTFDPKTAQYRTLTSDTLRVRVTPSTAPVVAGAGGREVRAFRRDLRAIREDVASLRAPRPWLIRSPVFWLAQTVPLLLFVQALRAGHARRMLEGNVTLARARGANRVARRRLAEARRALAGQAGADFYTILGGSLSQYASDKLGLSRHGIPRDELLETLRARGIGEEPVSRLEALLERCDMGRFAPGGDASSERADLLRKGEKLIIEMERDFVG
jgi:hypothetical protein